MKLFFLPIGRTAGESLPTILSAMSCGSTRPVTDLNILHLTDGESDPVLPPLIQDLNQMHALFEDPDNLSLFPSSFTFSDCRPILPSLQELASDASSADLIGALRGKGIPLSYKTDREAVEWAFSEWYRQNAPDAAPFSSWIRQIRDCLSAEETIRVAVLCNLCDPMSSGAAFAALRFLRDEVSLPPASLGLFCLMVRGESAAFDQAMFTDALFALGEQDLVGRPDCTGTSCADAVWLLSLPSALVFSNDSNRVLYAALARRLADFFSADKAPASGLHTVFLPGTLTFQALAEQHMSFAAFLHVSAWLLSDLLPSLLHSLDHPSVLRSFPPHSKGAFLRRLIPSGSEIPDLLALVSVLRRALSAVLAEILLLLRHLPDQLRLSSVSDPLWQNIVDACGRTVTVASEYMVSRTEAEEGGLLDIHPVHRVSLADTAEEKAERRLERIALQLADEKTARNLLFDSLGHCWAVPAIRDCRTRCEEALDRARKQYALTGEAADADRLTIAAMERRIRLLKAAIAFCDEDLSAASRFAGPAASLTASTRSQSPFSGQMLNAAPAEKLFTMLNAPDESSASVLQKDVADLLPSLFFGFTLPDQKTLLKYLSEAINAVSRPSPIAVLGLSALSVSRNSLRSLHFLSDGMLPAIPLLPDLYPAEPPLTVSALLPLIPSSPDRETDLRSEKRGLFAMLLLRQYRRAHTGEGRLTFRCYSADASPVLQAWLSSVKSERVWMISLNQEEDTLPFALLLPGRDLLPARMTEAHAALLPSFSASWFDTEHRVFLDPCDLLSQGDTAILLEQLSRIVDVDEAGLSLSFRSFLRDFREDLSQSRLRPACPDRLDLRLKAAFGLRLLPAFSKTLLRTAHTYENALPSDTVLAHLLDRPAFPAFATPVPDDLVYTYRDVPFARENAVTLLDAIPFPGENWTLRLLEKECALLSNASDDYHDAQIQQLNMLLARYPDAIPEARQTALDLLKEAARPVSLSDFELSWPWDPDSPSVLTILSESLGPAMAEYAIRPFSDLLTLFPARGHDVIGDVILSSMCLLMPSVSSSDAEDASPPVMPDAVLPPLSPAFCAALCRLPEGKTLFRQNLLSFVRTEQGAVRVTLTLEGRFSIRLIRDYSEDEIRSLYSHDIPTLAVWPNLPFAPEDWRAYFVYANFPSPLRISVFSETEGPIDATPETARFVSRFEWFPLSFSLWCDRRCMGSLPNLLPAPDIEKTHPCTACLDFGSVGTSVVFTSGHHAMPMQGATLVRTLLNNPAFSPDLLRNEFLPAVPVSALIPTAVRLYRNQPGSAPLPFEDGIVLMSANLPNVLSAPTGSLYTSLKWEEEKGRSVSLCLHQVMLMAALQARTDGASRLGWRFSVPDEMAETGRAQLLTLFRNLADQVCQESGFETIDSHPPVTFATDSAALGAYFRYCAPEDTRGGFMVLDIGACTADISLFLRAQTLPVCTSQLPLGVHYMLMPSLLLQPDLLPRDLDFVQDPVFMQTVNQLNRLISSAKSDSAALRHARLALDSLIADHYAFLLPGLLHRPDTGAPTWLGSVLLFHFSYLMMLCGLMLLQISSDSSRNDFIPEQMTLCLSGRGSLLIELLPDGIKTALWRFLTMFRNRRVVSLSLLFSSEKKMEIPVGLSCLQDGSADSPLTASVPDRISVRPEELLPGFMLTFAKEFPAASDMLFHGFLTGEIYHPFTPYGESLLVESIHQTFSVQTAQRPFDALASWPAQLLELLNDAVQ